MNIEHKLVRYTTNIIFVFIIFISIVHDYIVFLFFILIIAIPPLIAKVMHSFSVSLVIIIFFFIFLFFPNFYVNELTFFHFDYYIHHLLITSASFSFAVCYTCLFKATSLYSSESAPYFNLVSLNVLCCSNPGLPDTFFNF